MDVLTPEQRHRNMAAIRSSNTKPEQFLRSLLWRAGFRFRKNVRSLPGTPDIVLPKLKTVIFVHGCFWHRHPGCKYATTPKTRIEFWNKKFQQNITRDTIVYYNLQQLGWRIFIVWECELKNKNNKTIQQLINILKELDNSDAT